MKICVYGASSSDINEAYMQEGESLGQEIAKRGHTLVFGAGNNGMMGASARGTDRGGGELIGIAPTFFNVDGALYKCKNIIRPNTMRERKQLLEDKSDAFVITVGGIGTMDEFFEILTLKQLGRHNKPIVILNSLGFYDKMLDLLDFYISQKVLFETTKNLFHISTDPREVIDYIENYKFEKIDPSHYKKILRKEEQK